MSSILVINAAGRETRVALVENGHIAEFYLERKKDKGIVGNIYKGRVVRVLPGMQAAFVDIGLEKAAFLYVSDVVYDPDFARAQFELTEGEHDEAPDVPEEGLDHDEHHAHGNGHGEHPMELEVHELAPGELQPPPEGVPAEHHIGELPAVGVSEQVPAAELPAEGAPALGPADAHAPAEPHPAEGSTLAAAPAEPVAPLAETVEALAPVAETAEAQPTSPGAESSDVDAGDLAAAAASEPSTPSALSLTDAAAPNGGAVEGAPSEPGAIVAQAALAPAPPAAREERPREREQRGERRTPRDAREARERNRERDRDRDRDRGDKQRRPEEKPKVRKEQRIEDLLKPGQEVVVQVSKDPIGTKGARLTSHISIPGRHLVFMPTVDHVGISRRISNEKERRRLREIVDRMRPPGTGFIVRTVAENVPSEKLESDIRFLIEVWNQVVRKNEKRSGPGLLHADLDLILRATRDLFAHDVEKLVVDDRDEYERILGFVTAQDPALKDRILLHDGDEAIFDAYGIEQEINRAVQRKVWLKSGGYLIIDQAEALTAIDVNSGRYVGKKSLEETITKINIEAAKEIVYQLRLRNIGGIIICDFIDMEKTQNRDKVFKALQEALGRDKAKTNVLKISELGLVEMTRKRVRESIGRILHEDCAYCDGKGFVKTATTVCYEIFRDIRREAPNYRDPTMVINCNSEVAKLLQGDERNELRHLMDRYNKSIQVKAQQNYHREQYDIYGRSIHGSDQKVVSNGAHLAQRGAESGGATHPERLANREREQQRGGREGRRDRDRGRGGRDRGEREGSEREARGEGGERERGNRGGGGDRDRGNREGGGERDRGNRGDREGGGERDRGNRGDREGGGERDRGNRDRESGGERDRGNRGDRNRGDRQDRRDRNPPPAAAASGGTSPAPDTKPVTEAATTPPDETE